MNNIIIIKDYFDSNKKYGRIDYNGLERMNIMLMSMTGFGRGESSDKSHIFTVEMKSLNHRYNDIIIKMPKHINYMEENIKKMIKKRIKRGRVEVYIGLEYLDNSNIDVKVDIPLAKAYKEALSEMSNNLNLNKNITIDHIIKMPEVVKTERKEDDENKIWLCLEESLKEALDKLVDMRSREGNELSNNINKKTLNIKNMVEEIEERTSVVVVEYKKKLEDRVGDLLNAQYEIDENKLANEIVFFADKSSIDEEIVRLYSHVNQLIECLNSNEPIGRKLDFLIQEMNREINTIGSKSNDIVISRLVVEIKSELEKIREQIQNVE